jgi:glutamate-1-semialdehyde 2,1-aminomutase
MTAIRNRSLAYHTDAETVIAGGVNSNVRLLGSAPPLCFAVAQGAHLIDLDGNDYIDYALGMGPAILGHAPKAVTHAVADSLNQGQLYAGQSVLEADLARRLQQHVPGAELVRIGMTGSEMVQAAVRLARAATGRTRLVKFAGHYHGWFDNVLTNEVSFIPGSGADLRNAQPQTEGQSRAALADTVVLPWNDLDTLRGYLQRYGTDTAALIMEPVMCNTGVIPPGVGYLQGVRKLCDEHGVLLIVDEVITGFRLGLGGAQALFKVTGDLAIFAKALGGGIPIAALTGRRALMARFGTGSVNHSGTYNANVPALAAGIATLDALAADRGAAYSRIEKTGRALMEGMRALAKESGDELIVQGYPSVFHTAFGGLSSITSLADYQRCDEPRKKSFLEALTERGVRPTARGTWFVSAAHGDAEVDATLAAVREALSASPPTPLPSPSNSSSSTPLPLGEGQGVR